jgi:subtilisin family serine protease
MKRTFLFITLVVFALQLLCAQEVTKTNPLTSISVNAAPSTAKLLFDLAQEKSILLNSTSLQRVGAFIVVSEDFNNKQLLDLGVQINSMTGDIYTADIPINRLGDVLSIESVKYLQTSQKVYPDLYKATEATKADLVHLGQSINQAYTGKGVVVGIIDRGFDYTHPTFYNADGTEYRISRVWEQETDGTHPSGFTYGRELIGETAILNKAYSSSTSSHGTHVAGIAAGSGSSFSELQGLAYESEIVLVHPIYEEDKFVDALIYIFNYAESVGKPVVINKSSSNTFGPHDGTSVYDTECDRLAGEGKIIINSAGNSGSNKIHIDYNFAENDTLRTFMWFPKNAENVNGGKSAIDIWGEEGKDLALSIKIYDTTSNAVVDYSESFLIIQSSAPYQKTFQLTDSDPTDPDLCSGYIQVIPSSGLNGKPNIYLVFDNTDQDEANDVSDFVMLEIVGSNTKIDAWCSTSTGGEFTNLDLSNKFTDGNTKSTIGETGGCGKSVITVGSYNSTNSFTDLQGILHGNSSYLLNDISLFSSIGPTIDGRTKPDFVAPGFFVASAVNSFDLSYTSTDAEVVESESKESNTWYYAMGYGTSMSAPVAAGIVALMLEANPTLTPDEVKNILKNSAMTDSYTGTVPNNICGNGKVNALGAIQAIELSNKSIDALANNVNKQFFSLYPNPTNGEVTLSLSDFNYKSIAIFDISGKQFYSQGLGMQEQQVQLNLSHLRNGVYLLKLINNERVLQQKLILNK